MNPNKYNTNTKDTTGESNEDAVKSPFKRKINEPTNNDVSLFDSFARLM